ncbi:hypothetical protein QCE62_09585 [Caballeronia sp. LZ033]|uniref:hypothetical protein n=1 Tax=Caballeronia sp. LZ033 TaxID=3038566 RepID=UPI00285D5476|nr:hypothetical protein [Caballeronia sp. LZ033]MDR5813836.1 hypothetical protein [Caballeronia sp. LZ033]
MDVILESIDCSDADEFLLERMAIMEYDGGLKRYDAEMHAVAATLRYCERTGATEPQDGRYRVYLQLFARHGMPVLPEVPAVMTVAEVADRLDVSLYYLHRSVIDAGKLAVKEGAEGELVVDRRVAERYIAAQN